MAKYDVTLRTLTLGARDSWNGWRAVTWTTSTITMVPAGYGASTLSHISGSYASVSVSGWTTDPVNELDQIQDQALNYWTIETVKPVYDGNSLDHYECQLRRESMYQSSFGSTTWTLTRGIDPRKKIKSWIDTNARVAQITKNNDSDQASWATIFNNPPYPIAKEFRAAASPVNGLFVLNDPTSQSLINPVTQAPYGYEETVPIHIVTVDSTDCSGDALKAKMIAELRYVNENHPTGSLLGPFRATQKNVNLGGMMLYDTEYALTYKRDKAI